MRPFESLTNRGKVGRYRKVLEDGLQAYSLKIDSIRFVSMDSKPVFQVRTRGGAFAAKFHDPEQHELSQLTGELRFLAHIAKRSKLSVEIPLANTKSRFVTRVESPWIPEPVHLSLRSWLPGRELGDQISKTVYERLGRCAAQLHEGAKSFRPPKSFQILTNDKVYYWDKETLLSRKDAKLLPARRQTVFKRGTQFAERAIRQVWKSGKPRVIHSDLHGANVKVAGTNLHLFDFEDITWGFPEQDIGTAAYYIRFRDDYEALLNAFREGYEQVAPWPLKSARQLDAFVAARVLMLANYVVNYNVSPEEHLPRFEKRVKALLGPA